MAMSEDLFLAILSLDAYDQGYGVNLDLASNHEDSDGVGSLGAKVGSATIIAQDITQRAQTTGFYAVAYDWNGQKVISYRGTNSDTLGNFLTDALNGYFVGAGY